MSLEILPTCFMHLGIKLSLLCNKYPQHAYNTK